jgi:hypothetical protein
MSDAIHGKLFRKREGQGWTYSDEDPARDPVHRPARVALSLAQGHELSRAIKVGKYEGPADLARKLGLLPPRVTQLLDLTLLAPDIQEEILFLESVDGIEPISERAIRVALTTVLDFAEQRKIWAALPKKH